MSEFQLKEKQGYIYVGEYFHKFGGKVPTEKKIGKTNDLLKIPQIDDYAFSRLPYSRHLPCWWCGYALHS